MATTTNKPSATQRNAVAYLAIDGPYGGEFISVAHQIYPARTWHVCLRNGWITPSQDGNRYQITVAGYQAIGYDPRPTPTAEAIGIDERYAHEENDRRARGPWEELEERWDDMTPEQQACLAAAAENATDTAVEHGFPEYSARWYEIAVRSYHSLLEDGMFAELDD